MHERLTKDESWYDIATIVASRTRCVPRQVGAVIVSGDGRVVATGYNGPPAGLRVAGPCTNWCPQAQTLGNDVCYAAHAEINALMHSDRRERMGGTIYVTAFPCLKCGVAIANSGLSFVQSPLYEFDRADEGRQTLTLMERSGIQWKKAST